MSERIPTYQLQAFANVHHASPEVYFPDYAAAKPPIFFNRPYRGDYYKISLCLWGNARLKANLETYHVTPGSLIVATPDVIKEWLYISDDYKTLSIFLRRTSLRFIIALRVNSVFSSHRRPTCYRFRPPRRRPWLTPFAFCSRNTIRRTRSGKTSLRTSSIACFSRSTRYTTPRPAGCLPEKSEASK